ncbi:Protein hold'em [Sergentomyia squamirostris]
MTSSLRCWIKNLELLRDDTKNITIIGVIMGKSEAKIFSGGDGDERGVFSITLRDSERDTINCVFWGSKDFIVSTSERYKYGDVVSVDAKVSRTDGSMYQPKTTANFLLTINEGSGQIANSLSSTESFKNLLNLPLRSPDLSLRLIDIDSRGEVASGDLVDLFVIVRMIRPLREVRTRRGETLHCRDIVVMDRSFPGMLLTFWGKAFNERIDSWKPLDTCLTLYDIKSNYSSFHHAVTLTYCSRTLIAENVDIPEAVDLKAYAVTVPPLNKFAFDSKELPKADEIHCVMTVQQVFDRTCGSLATNEEQFTAVIYAVISKFDLDGCSSAVTERCSSCKNMCKGECQNVDCITLQFQTSQQNSFTFSIVMDLSDHSGTLVNCHVTQDAAEKLLNMSAKDFINLTIDERTELKWKTLLERCAVKIVVRKTTSYRPRIWIGIVECLSVDSADVADKIKMY